jgi:hypothetical protein
LPAKWGATATSALADGGSCSPDESARGCWPRRPNAAQRLTGETMAGQGCSTDGMERGTWASGPAQPSLGHGERAARKRAVERGKKKRAHLGDGGVSSRARPAPTAAMARSWRESGRRAEETARLAKKTARRAVALLDFRTAGSGRNTVRPGAWAPLGGGGGRRGTAPRAVARARARNARWLGWRGRWAGERGRPHWAAGARPRSWRGRPRDGSWAATRGAGPRRWRSGRAGWAEVTRGPTREGGGSVGPSGGGGEKGEEGGAGWAGRMG